MDVRADMQAFERIPGTIEKENAVLDRQRLGNEHVVNLVSSVAIANVVSYKIEPHERDLLKS